MKGIHGNYADEDLLAAISSEVQAVAAKWQGTTLVLHFAAHLGAAEKPLLFMCMHRLSYFFLLILFFHRLLVYRALQNAILRDTRAMQ